MQNSFWSPFVSDGAVKAIYWTLIHSLWIGLIIALFCGVIIATTRKSTAALRYRLLCSLLVLFVFSIGFTYCIEARSNKLPSLPSPPPIIVVIGADASAAQQAGTVLNRSIVDVTRGFLNQNANIIFMVWLVFFIFKSLKMISGLLHIQRIRNYKTQTVSEELKHRIELFAGQVGIRQAVRLVQSELVKVPVAVGWLKPMILLPVGIVFQLTPEQLDGILWHELAHIRRRDYLVNILQGIVETIFFFNPGLLWLSSLIRTEREACCDDMVLSRMDRRANYLEALLSFGYGEFKQPGFAMGLGSGNQLRDRLKRMINRENKRLGVVEKVVLVTGIVVFSAFAGLTKANKKYIRHLTNGSIEKAPVTNKMSPATGVASMPQHSNMVKPANGADDKKVDTSAQLFDRQYEWGHDEPGITYSVLAKDAAGTKYRFTVTKFKLVALTVNGNDVQKRNLYKYAYLLKHVPPPPPPPPAQPGTSGEKADTLNIGYFSVHSNRADGDTTIIYHAKAEDNHGKNYHFVATYNKLMSMSINGKEIKESDLPKYEYVVRAVLEKQWAMQKTSLEFIQQQRNKPQEPQQPTPPPSLDKMIADVTSDLIDEHIIKDKSNLLTIKLTYSELIVNGVKQPDEVQKKFAAKYYPGDSRHSHGPNYGLWYNAKTHGVALGDFNLDLDAL
jgi:bla regulator protein BlaR1